MREIINLLIVVFYTSSLTGPATLFVFCFVRFIYDLVLCFYVQLI